MPLKSSILTILCGAIFAVLVVHGEESDTSGSFNNSASNDSNNELATVGFYSQQVASNVNLESYVVRIRNLIDGDAVCAGALVAPQWVLTALLCSREHLPVEGKQYISIGSLYRNGVSMGEVIEMSGRERHPDLNIHTFENNYMLFKLKTASKYAPVHLAPDGSHYYTEGMSDLAFGWTSGDTNLVKTTLYNMPDCRATVPKVHASQICALETNRTGSCHLNRGSPVVVRRNNQDFLVGIVGVSNPCSDNNKPVLLARTSKGQMWTNKITGV